MDLLRLSEHSEVALFPKYNAIDTVLPALH